MDSKNIINSIKMGYLLYSMDQKVESDKQIIIDLKSSVCGFHYEFYTSLGQSLSGSYHKNLDIEKISNNQNQLIINLDHPNPGSGLTINSVNVTIFLKLFNVDVINVQARAPNYFEKHNEVIRLTSPIFHFMTLPPTTYTVAPQPMNYVQTSVDEVEADKEDSVLLAPKSPLLSPGFSPSSPRSLVPLPREISPDLKI